MMTTRTAYLWGPLSNFNVQLTCWLLEHGWHVHIPTKSALHVSLSPLDLRSSVHSTLDKVLAREHLRSLRDRVVLLDANETARNVTYDIAIFAGLPSNFDAPRVSRSPWAADEFAKVFSRMKGVPFLILSSIWAGIQPDGVVPEEIEFERRKPKTHYEALCQQYEARVLRGIEAFDGFWHMVRLPMITGNFKDGAVVNFSGLSTLLQQASASREVNGDTRILELSYNPDATLWMLPADLAANIVGRIAEDGQRPRICNLVSTQSRLNEEWLQDLALAADFKRLERSERGSLNLPGTLKAMLLDTIQVKTRNLFEVLGRYHHSPIVVDRAYFEKLLAFGETENWGHIKCRRPVEFSESIARQYFDEFLPSHLNERLVKGIAAIKGGIAFSVGPESKFRWILKVENGHAEVKEWNPETDSPGATISISTTGFMKLVQNKVPFEYALFSRMLHVEGKALASVKALGLLREFLKENQFSYANGNG